MEFRILGPVEASDDGNMVPLGGRRQRMVLAVLLLDANTVVSADRLIDGVWGEVPPSTARKTLQTYVARLRKVVGEESLTAADSGYVLHLQTGALDSGRFEKLAGEGRDLLESDPRTASQILHRSLAEWRGMPWGDLGDESVLRTESERLKELRLVVQEDRIKADLITGADAELVPELQGLVARHPWREGFAAQLMLALYRSGRQAEALRVFQDARRSLGEELGIDPSPELRQLEEQILMQDPELTVSVPPPAEAASPTSRNPYKGLRPFGETDSEDFHGRAALVDELVTRIVESPFVAVVGPSGSGKSSVVKAGVLPRLRRLDSSESGERLIATMVPGAHPFEEFETALLRAMQEPIAGLEEQMRGDDLDMLRCSLRVLPSEDANLVLVIDQFEELFVLTDDAGVRGRFFRNVVQAAEDPHSRLSIVATLRADFYDRVLSEPEIGPLVDQGLINVLPLATSELEAAALRPAEDAGATLEPELIAELIADTHDQPGALPLFQYVLTELYEERSGSLLTVGAYDKLGGLRGALASRANETFEGLDSIQRSVARQVFLRLVSVGDDGKTARQRVLRTDLDALGAGGADVGAVLERFDAARLMTFDRDPIEEEPTVEVAHEALFREWDRLRTWIAEARDDLRVHHSLAIALREWELSDRDTDYLVVGSRLGLFEAWRRDTTMHPTPSEHEYLDLSIARRRRDLAAETERRDRELEAKRRSVRRLQWLVTVAVVAAVVAATLAILAVNRGREARASQSEARAGELAYAASLNLEVDPERSILLALESIAVTREVDGTVLRESEEALHSAVNAQRALGVLPGSIDVAYAAGATLLATVGERVRVVDTVTGRERWSTRPPGDRAFSVAASADGTLIATGGPGNVVLWDAATGERVRDLTRSGRPAHTHAVREVVFSPDGSLLASVSAWEPALRIWDVQTGELVEELEEPEGARWSIFGGDIPQLAFHPDGTSLAVSGFFDAAVKVLDIRSREWAAPFPGIDTPVFGVRYFSDGSRLVSSDVDGVIAIWDVPKREVLFSIQPDNPTTVYRFIDVSDDGTSLIAAGTNDSIRIWDVSGSSARPLLTIPGRHGFASGLALSPDGTEIATATGEEVRTWDPSRAGRGEVFSTDGGGSAVAFSSDGTRLGLVTEDADIALVGTSTWDTQAVLDLPSMSDGSSAIQDVDWTTDDALIVTAVQGEGVVFGPGEIQTWDAATGSSVSVLSDAYPRFDVATGPNNLIAASICESSSPDRLAWKSPARVWDVLSGEELFAAPMSSCGHAIDIGPHGRLLALQIEDTRNVRVWNLETRQPELAVDHRPGNFGSVRFSPDGQRLLSAGEDGIRIWELETETEILHLGGNVGSVTRAEWVSDGTRVIAGDSDGAIRLWAADTGDLLLALHGHQGEVLGLSVSPDGTRIASSTAHGPTLVWTLDLDELIEIAKSRLTRSFTESECVTYHIDRCIPSGDDEDTDDAK